MTTANLLDFDLEGLAAFCERLGEKRVRATQLFRGIHQRGASDFAQMTDLAKSLREKLATTARVEARCQEEYDREVDSSVIGSMVMEELRKLHHVAYVRFASVYREFSDVSQFLDELKPILEAEKQRDQS